MSQLQPAQPSGPGCMDGWGSARVADDILAICGCPLTIRITSCGWVVHPEIGGHVAREGRVKRTSIVPYFEVQVLPLFGPVGVVPLTVVVVEPSDYSPLCVKSGSRHVGETTSALQCWGN